MTLAVLITRPVPTSTGPKSVRPLGRERQLETKGFSVGVALAVSKAWIIPVAVFELIHTPPKTAPPFVDRTMVEAAPVSVRYW